MRTVVIVDDEPIARMDISAMLEELSYQMVGEAGDGFDAVEVCRMQHPDIVLMDVKMPVFDGLTAAEKIIREKLAQCVILLTAFNDIEIIDRAKSIGVSGYLVKPIEQRLLRPTIEVAFAQSERCSAIRSDAERAKQQLNDTRLIYQAQSILSEREGIRESDAYRRLRSMSMEKRISIKVLAQAIIEQDEQSSDLAYVRTYLMRTKHLSFSTAVSRINEKAKQWNCSAQEAAKKMRGEIGCLL